MAYSVISGNFFGGMCLLFHVTVTVKGAVALGKKIIKSLDDGKVQIFSVFLFCFVETSKCNPKPLSAILNV